MDSKYKEWFRLYSTNSWTKICKLCALSLTFCKTGWMVFHLFLCACVCVTSGLRVALEQAGQMGPWREKAMGKRLVLFWQAWSSHTNQPCDSRTIRSITITNFTAKWRIRFRSHMWQNLSWHRRLHQTHIHSSGPAKLFMKSPIYLRVWQQLCWRLMLSFSCCNSTQHNWQENST